MNLCEYIWRLRKFSRETFGPPRNNEAGLIDHIKKELVEIEEAETNEERLGEWVDVIILSLDGAWRSGATKEQICQALQDKLAKNEKRTWPDWRTAEPGKAICHIKGAPDA
jgi:hypothetical protein